MSNTPALDKWRKEMSGRCPKVEPEVDSSPLGTIYKRSKVRVPTPGSQRRCYNGCFPSSDWEFIWTSWEVFSSNQPESKLDFWEEFSREGEEYRWERNSKE